MISETVNEQKGSKRCKGCKEEGRKKNRKGPNWLLYVAWGQVEKLNLPMPTLGEPNATEITENPLIIQVCIVIKIRGSWWSG
jgi:hypothetical protein